MSDREEDQEARLREALLNTRGNVTHAAAIVEFTKVHTMRLLKKYGLSGYARSLRRAAGSALTGRPAKCA